jgi:hypothetical protein
VARIAAEQGLKVEFVDPVINSIMQKHKEQLSDTKHIATLLVNSTQTSLAEAERIAKAKSFDMVKPINSKYRGSIVEITSHHVLQSIGKRKVVIHERAKFENSESFYIGSKVMFDYQSTKPKATVESKINKDKQQVR